MIRPVLAVAAAAALLAGCAKEVEVPRQQGVCYHVVRPDQDDRRFNVLASGVDSVEACAGQLEMMRLRFRALGSVQTEVSGAYGGTRIDINPAGMFVRQKFTGVRYPAMMRLPDGTLRVPGSVKQDQP